MSVPADAVRVALDVSRVLSALAIPHALTGSFASSVHGVPRMTRDVDFVVELAEPVVPALVQALETDYYADADMACDAIRRGSMFNLAHLATFVKVDLHCPPASPLLTSQMARRQPTAIAEGAAASIDVLSAEDIVISKLKWFEAGGRVSDQQWRDIIGVLQAQAGRLDLAYLQQWTHSEGVGPLLARALTQVLPT